MEVRLVDFNARSMFEEVDLRLSSGHRSAITTSTPLTKSRRPALQTGSLGRLRSFVQTANARCTYPVAPFLSAFAPPPPPSGGDGGQRPAHDRRCGSKAKALGGVCVFDVFLRAANSF